MSFYYLVVRGASSKTIKTGRNCRHASVKIKKILENVARPKELLTIGDICPFPFVLVDIYILLVAHTVENMESTMGPYQNQQTALKWQKF